MKRLMYWSALGVLAAALAGEAHAQDDDLTRAREHFEKGQRLYEDGKYVECAQEFKLAYSEKNFPQFHFNTAACLEKSREYAEAARYYERYIEGLPNAPDKAETEQRIAVLKKEAERIKAAPETATEPPSQEVEALGEAEVRGLVVIESEPANAFIYLDTKEGEPFSRTPWNGPLEGQHTIYIVKEGYKPVEKVIAPDPKKLPVFVFSLAEEDYLGWVNIKSNVPGADIYLDQKDVGVYRKTPWQGNIEPGRHKIWITKEGYDEFFTEIEVVRGQTHTVNAVLEGAPVGWVNIIGNVSDATVYLDGKVLCQRGPCRKPVPQGTHTLRVERPGFKAYDRRLEMQPQTEVTMQPRLVKAPGRTDAYIAYGFAAVFLGTGVFAGLTAKSLNDDLDREVAAGSPPPDQADPRFNRARLFAIGADAAFAVGTLSLAVAIYYTVRDKGPPSSAVTNVRTLAVEPQLSPGYAGLGVGVNW